MLGFFSRQKQQEPKLPPQATGAWLAQHLDERCTVANLTDDQRELAKQIGLPVDKLFDEVVVLSAFSIEFATLSLLHANPHQSEVRLGFVSGVHGWAAESVNKSIRVQSGLRERGLCYHNALMEFLAQPSDRLGDPLADAFQQVICPRVPLEQVQQSQEIAARVGWAHMLAVLTVQHDFWYYQELCQHMFKETGLVQIT